MEPVVLHHRIRYGPVAFLLFMGVRVCRSWPTALILGAGHVRRRNMAAHARTVPLSLSSSSVGNSHDRTTGKPLVVIIAGSTGIGKSDVAARLCQDLGSVGATAIVSADSVQAYRHVQIGANKPSAAELRQAPHLLLDVIDAHETYNAAEWMRDAKYAIERLVRTAPRSDHEMAMAGTPVDEAVAARRRQNLDRMIGDIMGDKSTAVPLVVGGTMMYLQWLLYGMPDAPSPTPAAVAQALSLIHI